LFAVSFDLTESGQKKIEAAEARLRRFRLLQQNADLAVARFDDLNGEGELGQIFLTHRPMGLAR
jgi:hypothetical protein